MDAGAELRLNFACGGTRWPGFVNSDINGEDGVVLMDLEKFPYPYKTDTASIIMLSHALFMTHDGQRPVHPDVTRIFAECYRILKPAGWLRIDDNPFRCHADDEDLDPGQALAESTRGYPPELQLRRAVLYRILYEAGFLLVEDIPTATTLIHTDDATRDALLCNHLSHYSFTVEAQK